MNQATRSQVDKVIETETHRGDSFAKVQVNGETGWVQLIEE